MTTIRGRGRALLLGAAGALAALLTACGGEGTAAPPAPAAVAPAAAVTGTFIGLADDGKTAVAIVAEPPAAGAATRVVRAYLCDGVALREWYPGAAPGNSASLTSDTSSSTFLTELTADRATGSATLPDGRAVTFTAVPATGPAGLFDITKTADKGSGTSTAGQRIELTYGAETRGAALKVDATVDGRPLPAGKASGFQPAEGARAIVLADGRQFGASKKKPSEGGSLGFHNSWEDI
jgi:hypothetical protein